MNPSVTAIITTHNRLELLKKAIESVLMQSYCSIELLVIDDASDLVIKNEIEKLAERVGFQYIYIPQNESRGGNHARNIGIRAAKGKYVAFLDDDDEWMPTKIEKQVALLEQNPCIKFCYCGKVREYNFGEKVAEQSTDELLDGDLSREILTQVLCTTSTMIVDRSFILEVGMFDESLAYWQEYELCIRLFQKTQVAVVRENLVLYRIIHTDKNRLTNKIAGWEEAVDKIDRKHAVAMESLTKSERKKRDLFRYYDGIRRCDACGDKARLRKYLLKIFMLSKNPRDLFKAITGQYELKRAGKNILFLSGAYQNRGGNFDINPDGSTKRKGVHR